MKLSSTKTPRLVPQAPPEIVRWHRRLRAPVVAAVLLAAASWTAGPPLAAQEPDAATAAAPAQVSIQLVYQGRIEAAGAPTERSYDFVFRLFTRGAGGLQVGPALTVPDLAVLDGSFAVDLDFGPARQVAGELWLEVALREGGREEDFTALAPRQRLTGTPYALLAQGGEWSLIGVPVGGPRPADLCPLPAPGRPRAAT